MNTNTCFAKEMSLFLFIFSIATTLLIILYTHNQPYLGHSFNKKYVDRSKKSNLTDNQFSSKVLTCMLDGTWKQRNMTTIEKREIEEFLHKAYREHFIPITLERPDGRCGNVTFDPIYSRNITFDWVRALCNPKGENPCCNEGRCVAASEKQCRCKNCADIRKQIHAEYSQWIPKDPNCPPSTITQEEACRLLNGSSLVFVGDSFLRHIYTALLMILRNDFLEGAMKRNVSDELRSFCRGMSIFTEKVCRILLDEDATVCNNSVSLRMKTRFKVAFAPNFTTLVSKITHKKSFLVLGIGIHDDFQPKVVWYRFLKPLIQSIRDKKWPKVLWTAGHAPGLLKTTFTKLQNRGNVLKFNRKLAEFLKPFDFPIFDTFQLTDGVMSFDGSHYGLGINAMKAQILLNYLKELESNDLW